MEDPPNDTPLETETRRDDDLDFPSPNPLAANKRSRLILLRMGKKRMMNDDLDLLAPKKRRSGDRDLDLDLDLPSKRSPVILEKKKKKRKKSDGDLDLPSKKKKNKKRRPLIEKEMIKIHDDDPPPPLVQGNPYDYEVQSFLNPLPPSFHLPFSPSFPYPPYLYMDMYMNMENGSPAFPLPFSLPWDRRRRGLSDEDALKYHNEVTESNGFDVSGYDGTGFGRYIKPVILHPDGFDKDEDTEFIGLAQTAVQNHNQGKVDTDKIDIIPYAPRIDREHTCGPVEFQRLMKMNVCGSYCYITLEAKDLADRKTKTYQAILTSLPGQHVKSASLHLFRMKPGA